MGGMWDNKRGSVMHPWLKSPTLGPTTIVYAYSTCHVLLELKVHMLYIHSTWRYPTSAGYPAHRAC